MTLLTRTLQYVAEHEHMHWLLEPKERRAAAGRLGWYRRNPGDLSGEYDYIGFAIAGCLIGHGPGWIPRVQQEGCRIADLAAKLDTRRHREAWSLV